MNAPQRVDAHASFIAAELRAGECRPLRSAYSSLVPAEQTGLCTDLVHHALHLRYIRTVQFGVKDVLERAARQRPRDQGAQVELARSEDAERGVQAAGLMR